MSEQLTYQGVLEMFRESREEFREIREQFRESGRESDRRIKEIDRILKETAQVAREAHKKISALGSRIGEIIENMVAGNIVGKFQSLGYEITQCGRNIDYEYKKLKISGEIDLFLEDGDVAILVEVKTSLQETDVTRHIERLEEYRRYADARGDKRRFLGAVAGAVVKKGVMNFAHANGMYVIIQSGEAVEIVPVPDGFQAKKW